MADIESHITEPLITPKPLSMGEKVSKAWFVLVLSISAFTLGVITVLITQRAFK